MATNDHGNRRTDSITTAAAEPLDPAAARDQLRSDLQAITFPSVPDRDIRQEVMEGLDESDHPLETNLLPKFPEFVTVGDWIRSFLFELVADDDDLRDTHHVLGGTHATAYMHPTTLAHRTQLFDPGWLAGAYRVGFKPTWLGLNVDGDEVLDVDEYLGDAYSFRVVTFEYGFEHARFDADDLTDVAEDTAAVDALAEHLLIDDTDWSQYLPWYRTRMSAAYQLARTADRTDWSALPPEPTGRPTVDAALEAGPDPSVGDFLRYAVVHDLTDHDAVRSVDTGPAPWQTDRVTITVEPWEAYRSSQFLPRAVLARLARYGYRPIDGWYLRPWWGHRSRDDPAVPWRIEFARGQALDRWIETRLAESMVGYYLDALPELFGMDDQLAPLSWAAYLRCLRAHIVTNLELKHLADDD